MTVPVAHGYPDWARAVAEADVVVLVADTFAVDTVVTTIVEQFVGDVPYLYVFCDNSAERLRLVFNWFADAAMTQLIDSDRYLMASQDQMGLTIPVVGPFLRLTGQSNAVAQTIDIRLIRTRVQHSRVHELLVQPLLIRSVALAVGIGATVNVDANNVLPGLAMWSVDTALATWTARLLSGDLAGTYTAFASMRQTSLPGPRLVYLPPSSTRASFTNTTGAAGTVDLMLVAHSFGMA